VHFPDRVLSKLALSKGFAMLDQRHAYKLSKQPAPHGSAKLRKMWADTEAEAFHLLWGYCRRAWRKEQPPPDSERTPTKKKSKSSHLETIKGLMTWGSEASPPAPGTPLARTLGPTLSVASSPGIEIISIKPPLSQPLAPMSSGPSIPPWMAELDAMLEETPPVVVTPADQKNQKRKRGTWKRWEAKVARTDSSSGSSDEDDDSSPDDGDSSADDPSSKIARTAPSSCADDERDHEWRRPKDCKPGAKSWTVKCAKSQARIQVLSVKKAFWISSEVRPLTPTECRTVPWGRFKDVSAAWVHAKKLAGFR
jgi:hypothetical protein